MNLARHSITSTNPIHILDVRFDPECQIFTTSTPAGFAVYRTWPLELVRKREVKGGTLAAVVPLHTSSLLYLVGGGRSPRYPPNKVILWDDAAGSEVAELEFRERVRGIACRRGWLVVVLRRRVAVFEVGETVGRYAEYETWDNPEGLVALASGQGATLLAIPGPQLGLVQLVHLPPCVAPIPVFPGPLPSTTTTTTTNSSPSKHPAKNPVTLIAAHTSALATLSLPPSGRLLATTSSKGTLVRTWDAHTGKLVREFRRGSDKAEIYGVAFRPDERELCVWSDKGTVHVFAIYSSPEGSSNRQSALQPLMPFVRLPKYFESEWSYAQYRIPVQSAHISLQSHSATRIPNPDLADAERCVVGWIQAPPPASAEANSSNNNQYTSAPLEHQLVALTYSGGWYRLSLPNSASSFSSSASSTITPNALVSMSSSPPKSALLASPRARSLSITSSVTTASPGGGGGKSDKGKEKEKNHNRECTLVEYRKYGRWDGWG